MKTYAYHFTGWLFHAGAERLLKSAKDPYEKFKNEQLYIHLAGKRFLKVVKAGALRAPGRGYRCAAQGIEILAGDAGLIWLTLDPSFGFASSPGPWSFGFVFDAEKLVRKYDAAVREADFINDYTSILRRAIVGVEPDKKKVRNDPKYVWKAFESLSNGKKRSVKSVFRRKTKAFREETELIGSTAIRRLRKKPLPAEIVVRTALPVDMAEACIVAGSIVEKKFGSYFMNLCE